MFEQHLVFKIAHSCVPVPDRLQVFSGRAKNGFQVILILADRDRVYYLIEIQITKELGRVEYLIRSIALSSFNEYAVESHGVE